jgi:hypothetical protein
MKAEGPRAAVQCYLAYTDKLPPANDAQPGELSWIDANAAWSAVLTGDRSFSALAEHLSKRALDAQPNAPETQGTRGAVLVEKGTRRKASLS